MTLRFRTWVAALGAAGLPSNPSSQVPRTFSDEEIAISAIVHCWRELDRPPTADDYERWSPSEATAPSLATARKLSGSWNTMLLRAWQVVHGIALDQDDAEAVIPPALLEDMDLGGGAQAYIHADERASYSVAMDTTLASYNAQERALTSHAMLQNAVAAELRRRRLTPLSPTGRGVLFDLAFSLPTRTTAVVEVKSATEANIEMQLRIGLGQVLRYARLLSRHGSIVPVLAIEKALPDRDWEYLLRELGVAVLVEGSLSKDLDRFLTGMLEPDL